MNNRSSGILLHPTSLPVGHCIGNLGTVVYQFVDLLDCVVYSGTHKNNTTLGWFRELSEKEKERLTVYIRKNVQEDNLCYELFSLAWYSKLQKLLLRL